VLDWLIVDEYGSDMESEFSKYADRLTSLLMNRQWDDVERFANSLLNIWQRKSHLFICGNGGSAANAIHLANDLLYGIGSGVVPGMNVEALTANSSVLTCLANDIDYESIFSAQIKVKGDPLDLLLVLSGSGNSPNVIAALEVAKELGMETWAILGFSGGKCANLADNVIHLRVEDMQLAEDFQLIVGHMCMQWLKTQMIK